MFEDIEKVFMFLRAVFWSSCVLFFHIELRWIGERDPPSSDEREQKLIITQKGGPKNIKKFSSSILDDRDCERIKRIRAAYIEFCPNTLVNILPWAT